MTTTSGSCVRTVRPPNRRPTGARCSRGGREDTIPLAAGRALRVLGVRDDDADQPPVLVVEDMPRAATSDAA
jgi:hypothetical protein